MSGVEIVFEARAPARVEADLLAAGFFFDERPLRGAAGVADWRLCGAISELILAGRLRGAKDDAVLVPSQGRLAAQRVLLIGLGRRSHFQAERAREAGARLGRQCRDLGVAELALAPPGPTGELAGLVAPVVAGLASALLPGPEAGGEGDPAAAAAAAPAEGQGAGLFLRTSLCMPEELHRPCRTALEATLGELGERLRFGHPRAPAPGLASLVDLPGAPSEVPAGSSGLRSAPPPRGPAPLGR